MPLAPLRLFSRFAAIDAAIIFAAAKMLIFRHTPLPLPRRLMLMLTLDFFSPAARLRRSMPLRRCAIIYRHFMPYADVA